MIYFVFTFVCSLYGWATGFELSHASLFEKIVKWITNGSTTYLTHLAFTFALCLFLQITPLITILLLQPEKTESEKP